MPSELGPAERKPLVSVDTFPWMSRCVALQAKRQAVSRNHSVATSLVRFASQVGRAGSMVGGAGRRVGGVVGGVVGLVWRGRAAPAESHDHDELGVDGTVPEMHH